MNSILFLFALRMFFYGHMISPWQVVLFEWIHGPIVGLFYPIMTSTAFQISPEGLTTTTTAVAYFMEGLGMYNFPTYVHEVCTNLLKSTFA